MELEGPQQMIQVFDRFQVKVKALVTDCHRQIQAWLRKNWRTMKHCFDCWYIAKSLKKRVENFSKKDRF